MGGGPLLAGTAGGIVGAITVVVGIVWSIAYIELVMVDVLVYGVPVYYDYYWSALPALMIYYLPYPFSNIWSSLFLEFSIILALLFFATGILTRIGFKGMSKSEGVEMGVFGSAGLNLGALTLLMGSMTQSIEVYSQLLPSFSDPFMNYFVLLISAPNWFLIKFGFLILGLSFIILGSASWYMRKDTAHVLASAATGVLSIIGAILLIIGSLISPTLVTRLYQETENILWLTGPVLTIVGFIIIFAALIIWTVVFYTSRDLIFSKKPT